MQATEQHTEIGQDSLTARNNTGERRESEPTQTATGPESLNSTTSSRSALSAAERSARDLEGPQNTAGPASEEHRRIFGYRPSSGASRSRPGSGNSRGRGRRQPAAFSPYFHRKNTWTRAFVCLAFSEQNALPSTSERITLTLNGLGEKKLQFPCNGNAAQVHEVIIDAFPALQTAGGYEVLRTVDGRSKDLICIPTPASGISVPFLKSVLGQAKGFLRPLQKDIVIQAELPEGKAAP